MTKPDYTKRCWYCGSALMENKGDYYQCQACSATWAKPPTVGPASCKLAKDYVLQSTSGSPTPATIARIAKERAINEEKLRQAQAAEAKARKSTARKRTRASPRTA